MGSEAVVLGGESMLGWARPRHFGFGGLTKGKTYRSGGGSSAGSHEL